MPYTLDLGVTFIASIILDKTNTFDYQDCLGLCEEFLPKDKVNGVFMDCMTPITVCVGCHRYYRQYLAMRLPYIVTCINCDTGVDTVQSSIYQHTTILHVIGRFYNNHTQKTILTKVIELLRKE